MVFEQWGLIFWFFVYAVTRTIRLETDDELTSTKIVIVWLGALGMMYVVTQI